jgi:allantoin racemase
MHAASLIGNGFTIVSMLERTRATMEHLVHAYGMTHKCRNIRMTDLPVLELEQEGSDARAIIVEECRRALVEDHSDSVLLGCGGMSDLMAHITREIGAPAIDGVSCGVKLVESLVSLGLGTSKRQSYAYPVEKVYTGSFSQYSRPAMKV